MIERPVQASLNKSAKNAGVPHNNERVELAFNILEVRHKLRRVGWDTEQAERLRRKMEQLEQKLREIDE